METNHGLEEGGGHGVLELDPGTARGRDLLEVGPDRLDRSLPGNRQHSHTGIKWIQCDQTNGTKIARSSENLAPKTAQPKQH